MEGYDMKSKMASLLRGFSILLLALWVLGGCGSPGGMDRGDGPGDDPSAPPPITETVGSVVLSASRTSILADGQSTTVISARVSNSSGILISRAVTVSFSSTGGTLSAPSAVTENGIASVVLTSATMEGNATVSASAEGVGADDPLEIVFTAVPSHFAISASQNTVKSDNSDSATVTVTILDSSRVPIEGIPVNFLVNGGQISASTVFSNEQGQAQVVFRSGDVDQANKTVTITAEVPAAGSRSVPIQIVGTTVSLSTDKTNLDVERGDVSTLTIQVRDAGDRPVFDAPVSMVVIPGSPGDPSVPRGNLRLRLATDPEVADVDGVLTGRTNANGNLRIEVTGQSIGRATVEVTSLGDTRTQSYAVSSTAETFAIVSPEQDPVGLFIGEILEVRVRNPNGAPVQFSTTFGWWTNDGENRPRVVTVPVGPDNIAIARLVGDQAGIANVQVFDTADTDFSASREVAIAAPSSSATQISLQANPAVVAPSSGESINTVTLTATVRNINDQVVGNAPVAFSIEQTTGGGERISPVIAYTNASGVATTTFFSGSLSSSGEGIRVRAVVLSAATLVQDTARIVIGGTAGSVLIGRGTLIRSSDDGTHYIMPMSVLVVDSNGNPVPGARVALGAWPTRYRTGFWTRIPPCFAVVTGTFPNEDRNRNLILDPGEDLDGSGELTPPSSAAGAVGPVTQDGETGGSTFIVETGQDGVAAFQLTYLKTSAVWIETEVSASTAVFGSETRTTYTDWLPYLEGESCNLPDSPYNLAMIEGRIDLFSEKSRMLPNGVEQSLITAFVRDAGGNPIGDDTLVSFTLSGPGRLSVPAVLTSDGMASVLYTSGNQIGTATITASAKDAIPDSVTIVLARGELILTPDRRTLVTNGTDEVRLDVQLFDLDNNPLQESTQVLFRVVSGPAGLSQFSGLEGSSGRTDARVSSAGGTATAYYKPEQGVAGTVVIEAVAEGIASNTDRATISLTSAPIGAVQLSANPTSLVAGSTTFSTITAVITTSSGDPAPAGTPVSFSVTGGGSFSDGSPNSVVRDDGIVTARLFGISAGTAVVTVTSGGISEKVNVEVIGTIGQVNLSAVPGAIPPGQEEFSTITANVRDATGQAAPVGTDVGFRIESGPGRLDENDGNRELTKSIVRTDGIVAVRLSRRQSVDSSGIAVIAVRVGAITSRINVEFQAEDPEPLIQGLTVTSNQETIAPDASGEAVIAATIEPIPGQSPDGITVEFQIVSGGGTLSVSSSETVAGIARTTLTGTGGTAGGSATIQARAQGFSDSAQVNYAAGNLNFVIVSPGSGSQTSIRSGESVTVQAQLTGASASGRLVTFSMDNPSLGTLTPLTATTDGSGIARTTFRSTGPGGTVKVRASAPLYPEQSVTINIGSAPPAFIELSEGFPDPSLIGVRGTQAQSASIITFDVKDATGAPAADGFRFDFEIVSGPNGGEELLIPFAATSEGQVSTTLRTGTKPGPVMVRAKYHEDANVGTTSTQIAIQSGLPVGEEFGIRTSANVDGGNFDIGRLMCVSVADVYGNSVADGTVVNVKTYNTGGFINEPTISTEGGTGCTTLFYYRVGNTQPFNGIISVTAETTGDITTRVNAFAVHAENPFNAIIYAATNGGGVYKSTDSGTTWRNVSRSTSQVGQNWIDPFVNDIAIDPRNPNTVYAATGYGGKGNIFQSLDGGITWDSNNDFFYDGILVTPTISILTLAIDDASNTPDTPAIWAGTDGFGILKLQANSRAGQLNVRSFGTGLPRFEQVNDIVKVKGQPILYAATTTGVYRSTNGGDNWAPRNDPPFVGYFINTLELHPSSTGGGNDVIYAGTRDNGVWISTDSGRNWIPVPGLGKALRVTTPKPDRDNTGTGTIENLSVLDGARSENWTVVFDGPLSFRVTGSVSGAMDNVGTVDAAYEVPDMLRFTVQSGGIDFVGGDRITFTTIRDDGKHIKDLLVDSRNDVLYALTYFDGALEPHATSNLFARDLESNGAVAPGSWRNAGQGLPQFAPPTDRTLFAHWALASIPESNARPNEPKALLVGGEDVNIYKASSGLTTGQPNWTRSNSGLSRLIMARVPVLIDFPETAEDRALTFGPFSGTTFFRFELMLDGLVEFEVSYFGEGSLETAVSGQNLDEEIDLGTITLGGTRVVRRDLPAGVFSLQGTESRPADASIGSWQVMIRAISPIFPVD